MVFVCEGQRRQGGEEEKEGRGEKEREREVAGLQMPFDELEQKHL